MEHLEQDPHRKIISIENRGRNLKTKLTGKLFTAAVGLALLSHSVVGNYSHAAPLEETIIPLPEAPAWGHFADTYKNNTSANKTVESNPAIGILSGFLELWTPGDSWDNGTKLNEEILNANIQYVADIAKTRTPQDETAAYYDDRRNQTYGAADGLGALSEVYRAMSGTYTTITSIPDDATTQKYNDGNGDNKGGDSTSELGKMVDLIGVVRGNYASTSQAKNYYSYMRPYRWLNDTSAIVPTLVPAISSTPATDGGFPSGHTNASYLAAYAMAYAVPERFQELLTRASEMGNNRIVAGMHSPLDVMGGRVMATALAAATLADPDNTTLKQAAYDQAHASLLTATGTAEDRFRDYDRNKAQYTQRLTYGFPQINSTTTAATVPKSAEVLLETRQPYLSAEQRRAVLATTALPSGYPVLDDPEGWGRLNLFAAADGYGAFTSDVTVTMDGSKGGFHAVDSWRNPISGAGRLFKQGSGTLRLLGSNTYAGGTQLEGGSLEGGSATAFGSGDVVNNGGQLVENVDGKLMIGGSFTQAAGGSLELNVSSASDVLAVAGAVTVNGKLRVKFTNGYTPEAGKTTLISYDANQQQGTFSSIELEGVPSKYQAKVVYEADRIALSLTAKSSTYYPGGGSETGVSAGSGTGATGGASASNTGTGTSPAEQQGHGTGQPAAASVQITASEDANGLATAILADTSIQQAITQAAARAAGSKTVTLVIDATGTPNAIQVTLSKSALSSLSGSSIEQVIVGTSLGTVSLNTDVLKTLNKAVTSELKLQFDQADAAALGSEAKLLVGTRPILTITAQSGSSNISSLDGGTIRIDIPYTPAAGEDIQAIIAYSIGQDGMPAAVRSQYSEGKVTLITSRLSRYAVGYHKVSFNDTASHWGSSFITFLAARDMINGDGDGSFAPDRSITRAEFVKLLSAMAQAGSADGSAAAFDDVSAGDWFAPYVAWAAEQGIVKGSLNGEFRPYAPIRREEMAVMLVRFAAQQSVDLRSTVDATVFTDQSLISAWAADAIASLQQAELFSGKTDNRFDPQGSATRAEAAKLLTLLLQRIQQQA